MFSWSREELHLLEGCFLGQERNCIYLQEAAVCISSLIQTGIVTIQSWTSVTEVNLSPLTPRQEFCVVFPDQMLWCPKLSAPYEPQIPTSFYPHCLSTALSASYSLDFFLLLAKKKKKDTWGKRVTNAGSHFCILFLSQIFVLKFFTALLTLEGLQIFVLLSSFLAVLKRRVGFYFMCVIDCMQK